MSVDTVIVLLLCIAFVMLLIELFTPDFGVCGGIGLLALIIAAVAGIRFTDYGLIISIICASLAVAVVFTVRRALKSKKAKGTIILDSVEKVDKTSGHLLQPGIVGVTLTSLRPIGYVSFRGYKSDAICEHGILEQGVEVILTRINEGKVYVKQFKGEGEN